MNRTEKEPLRCVVISFWFDFICWHSISLSFEPVELSRVRFPAKLSRTVSVSSKQSKQVRSIDGLIGNQDYNRTKGTSFIAIKPHFGCISDCFDYERNAMCDIAEFLLFHGNNISSCYGNNISI